MEESMKKFFAFFLITFVTVIMFANNDPAPAQEVPEVCKSFVQERDTYKAQLDECKEQLAKATPSAEKAEVKVEDAKKSVKSAKDKAGVNAASDKAVIATKNIENEVEKSNIPEEAKKEIRAKAKDVYLADRGSDGLKKFEIFAKSIEEMAIAMRISNAQVEEALARLTKVEAKVEDHETRLDNIEEGVFGGYFGAGFMTSSIFDTAGYGTVGTLIKIGSLKGKFKLDLGASLYGSEVKNLLGFEGRGLIRWASEDFKYINIALGGAGGMMADVNNTGSIANAYGGGIVELEALFKEHYGIVTSILLGASDKQEINGSHDTNFLWCFNVGVRYHF